MVGITAFPAASRHMGLPVDVFRRISLLDMTQSRRQLCEMLPRCIRVHLSWASRLINGQLDYLGRGAYRLQCARAPGLCERKSLQSGDIRLVHWRCRQRACSHLSLGGFAGQHIRFLALPSEATHWRPSLLSAGLSRCLASARYCALTCCHYGAHSLRIGAHTVQVLIGIPLQTRLARFE
jgi:hypothetical protein